MLGGCREGTQDHRPDGGVGTVIAVATGFRWERPAGAMERVRPLIHSGGFGQEGTVETVVLGDLTAEFELAPALLRIRLTGRSASREAGDVLAPLFDRALAEGKADSRAVVLHFE